MSKVSMKNEILPSFEPLDKPKASVKRKRSPVKDNLINENEKQTHKKVRAKKGSAKLKPTKAKSIVFIGATLMQDKEDIVKEQGLENNIAAFSIYYGLDDKRNVTEKVTLKQDQHLKHVYIMGINRALEDCEDEDSTLYIHIGVLNQADQEIANEVKEKLDTRKGSTFIISKDSNAGNEEFFNIAHEMAAEKLYESEDSVMIKIEEDCVESLEIAEKPKESKVYSTVRQVPEMNNDNTILTDDTIMAEIKQEEIATDKDETFVDTDMTINEETPNNSSWLATLNLRNLLDIFKAPFSRSKKN